MIERLNDDHTEAAVIEPGGTGYAQADPTHITRKKKHPLGFTTLETKARPKAKRPAR